MHITEATFQSAFVSLGREASQGTESRPQRQCGNGRLASIEAIYLHRETVDVSLTHFPIPNHTGDLKGGKNGFELGLMLILVSDLCDIQSQVTTTAWHECCPGFFSKYIASWLSENHASPCRVSRNDKRKELSCSCF